MNNLSGWLDHLRRWPNSDLKADLGPTGCTPRLVADRGLFPGLGHRIGRARLPDENISTIEEPPSALCKGVVQIIGSDLLHACRERTSIRAHRLSAQHLAVRLAVRLAVLEPVIVIEFNRCATEPKQ